jgi:hypothetical protein
MQHIETVTVGSGGAGSITFSAIAEDWTDLVLKYSLRSNAGQNLDTLYIKFNGSSSGYSGIRLRGTGTGVASQTLDSTRLNLFSINGNTTPADTFSIGNMYVANYTSSTSKSVSIEDAFENNSTVAWHEIVAGLWSNSSAINSIQLTPLVGTLFLQYSSASLYGITAGSDGTTVVS